MLQVSYHTHIPEYIPKYTWKGLVGPMWRVIRFNILMADLTLVPSKTMKVSISRCHFAFLPATLPFAARCLLVSHSFKADLKGPSPCLSPCVSCCKAI